MREEHKILKYIYRILYRLIYEKNYHKHFIINITSSINGINKKMYDLIDSLSKNYSNISPIIALNSILLC